MAHVEQVHFCNSIKNNMPERFKNCSVLDIGSLDINGNNNYLFSDYDYIGVDVGRGKNVNVISKGHEFDISIRFDVVISTECFEHDPCYADTIKNAIRLLKPGGLFLFTCATTGRPEHGTSRSDGKFANPLGSVLFHDYYKNLTEQDIREVVNPDEIFSEYKFSVNELAHDLYFYGIKK